MKLYAATAMYPGDSHSTALAKLQAGTHDAGLPVSLDQVQLCPQSYGRVSTALLQRLQVAYPATRFRLHATCRLYRNGHRRFEGATPFAQSRAYFAEMAELSRVINAPAYSLHAGRRIEGGLTELRTNVLAIQALFHCPVAVEGLYPAKDNALLISTWGEYRWLMESGLYYALDMSHLQIVARRARRWDEGLTQALLQHPNCLEVHISDNNGHRDEHKPIAPDARPPWWPLLQHVNPAAVVFTESNQRKRNAIPSAK